MLFRDLLGMIFRFHEQENRNQKEFGVVYNIFRPFLTDPMIGQAEITDQSAQFNYILLEKFQCQLTGALNRPRAQLLVKNGQLSKVELSG